jgi:hypothetical protein
VFSPRYQWTFFEINYVRQSFFDTCKTLLNENDENPQLAKIKQGFRVTEVLIGSIFVTPSN